MPTIQLQTEIDADLKVVFDLARSIDFHQLSVKDTHEKAIAGKTTGLIDLGEFVTWRAKHFGLYMTLTSEITTLQSPYLFVDKMVNGPFKGFTHEHLFTDLNGKALMIDIFHFEAPLGFLGKLANKLFLENYMKELLLKRNQLLKELAESEKWQTFVSKQIKTISPLPFHLKKLQRST